MRETRKLAVFLLILAIIVSCICFTAAATAANTTATATPVSTPKPAGGGEVKPAVNATGSITGTVFDAAGNLVPDADVYLHDGRGVAMGLTVSDQNGTYSYTELDQGNYSIVVQVDGYAWFKKFVVTAGYKNVSNIYIPDYIHYPPVTPWPVPMAVNNSTLSGSKNSGAVTPVSSPKPAINTTASNSTGTGNMTKPAVNTTANSTAGVNGSAVNESAEASEGGSPIDGIISGIVGFFQSLFGMSG